MKKRRSREQIVGLLRRADVDLGKGAPVPDDTLSIIDLLLATDLEYREPADAA